MAFQAIAATIAVAGTAYSVSQGQKAAKAQRAAAGKQIEMQQQQAARERRSAIRASIIRRAQLQSQAVAAGVETSSGVLGGQTSMASQLGANLGFGNVMSGLSREYTQLTAQAADYSARSQMGSAISSIGFQAFPYAAQFDQARASSKAKTPTA